MKRLLYILIFASSFLHAQDNNALVLQFIEENMGKKVGSGVCMELATEATCYIDSVNGVATSSDNMSMTAVVGDYFFTGDIAIRYYVF